MSVTESLGLHLDPLETFMIEAGGFFMVAGIVIVVILLTSRSLKNRRQRVVTELHEAFQPSLNVMLAQSPHEPMPDSSQHYHLEQLQKAMAQDRIGKQVMIDYLIALKRSLAGTATIRVDEVYRALGLHLYSENKMHSRVWKLQAQGIRELATMKYHLPEKLKRLYVRARHETLREEVFMAITRTEQDNPLSFLTDYAGKISPWMQLNLHHYLSLMDPRKLPDFSQWFSHLDEDVVIFCLQMTAQFRQATNVSGIAALLEHKNPRVVESAIQALYNLGAIEYANDVIRAAERYPAHINICLLTVDFLELLEPGDPRLMVTESYLDHPEFVVRKKAVCNLLKEEEYGRFRLSLRPQTPELQALIEDATEPLLH
ncbi:MAG TPA: hypothetical protein PLX35_06630 [Cyclobacteriaceae bacterium]|nr:hypothetical protein [Cyclobacteriaceae bacterium]